jgi:hypothetical protein
MQAEFFGSSEVCQSTYDHSNLKHQKCKVRVAYETKSMLSLRSAREEREKREKRDRLIISTVLTFLARLPSRSSRRARYAHIAATMLFAE